MSKNHIKLSLPNWWQSLVIIVVLIFAIRADIETLSEAMKYLFEYWSSG